MLPEVTVQLCWIPGEANSSDLVSKLFQDPFKQANSNLFRFGPTFFRTNEVKHIFLEVTKSYEKYHQLPDEILKVQKKKKRVLADASAQDSFGNKEKSRLQCVRCFGEEDEGGTVMLVQTRSKGLIEGEDGSITSKEAEDGSSTSVEAADGSTTRACRFFKKIDFSM